MPKQNGFAGRRSEERLRSQASKSLSRDLLCRAAARDEALARPLLALAWEVWNA